jgi:hypothetical protein
MWAKVPAGQLLHAAVPAFEYSPSGHSWQAVWPVDGMMVPAGHCVQDAWPVLLV